MYTRYEFGGTGIFHALNLLNDCDIERADKEDLIVAESIFDMLLPFPNVGNNEKKTICYFTEKGVSKFRKELDTILYMFSHYLEDAGCGEIDVIKKENLHIVYEDEWQVVAVAEDCL